MARHAIRLILFAAAGAFAAFPGPVSAGQPRTFTAHSPACGPAKGKTLLAGRKARVYTLSRPESPGGPEVQLVFACLVGSRHSRLLGSTRFGGTYQGKWIAVVNTKNLVINDPWIAYPAAAYGVDTSALSVITRNLATNELDVCGVGGSRAPEPGPSIVAIALKGNGSVAWSGDANENDSSILGPIIPKVAACDSTGFTVLDSGEGIDLESLKRQGSTLTWTDSGVTRTAILH